MPPLTTISFVRLGRYDREGRARFAQLLGMVLAFCVYKRWAIGPDTAAAELWLGVLFDASVWSGLWLLAEIVSASGRAWSERAASLLFYPLLYLSAGLVFAHTWFYYAAIERRLTAFDVTLGGVLTFFRDALPLRGYLALSALLLGAQLVAYGAVHWLRRPSLRRAVAFVLPAVALCGAWSQLSPRTPSVLFDTGKELWQLATLQRLTPRPFARAAQRLAELDKSSRPALIMTPRFKKVIVLVMETMTTERFKSESANVARASFLHSERSHTHRFSRYFPNNQDSRTGMLAMLCSRLIPYEAYADRDVAAYAGVAARPSLVSAFAGLGYRTAFAVSQLALEEVVSDFGWDERLHLTQSDIDRAKQKQLCFEPDEYENGCEDLALLPKLVEFVRDHERAFVYQEFIWGHASEYNTASGKTNAAYYSGYVDALLARLRAEGLAEDTLVALTSDHGFRDKSKQAELGVYQIPLWLHASRFTEQEDARLFSHVDFRDILFSELSGESTPLAANELVMIVGPTGSGMITAISQRGDFTLLRRRAGSHMLLAHRTAAPGALAPEELLYLFERQRASFDADLRGPRDGR